MTYSLTPIATIASPYQEKFGTPRQSGLTPSVRARIVFLPEFATPEAVRGLAEFSHIWLLFIFHQNWQKGWQPTVRPPRLGGNKRVGVYASRSPFRPNPIGLSVVKLLAVDNREGEISLEVEGADLIDGTPVVDIKPYLGYADSIPAAVSGFASEAPRQLLDVVFSDQAISQLQALHSSKPLLEVMIRETLSLDPRPAYRPREDDDRTYGMELDGCNVRWRVAEGQVIILAVEARPC